MKNSSFISENKSSIAFTFIFMIVVSVVYFVFAPKDVMATESEEDLFENARFKVAFGIDGDMNIFVNTKNNMLSTFKVAKGNPIPEENSIVIGNNQVNLLKKQGKFSKADTHLINYFGINVTVEGVLSKRNDMIDDLNFLSSNQFDNVDGELNTVFSKMGKLFFTLSLKDSKNSSFKFAQGSISGYNTHNLDGRTYYPIILGYREAKTMKEEKLFSNTGDQLRNFFGKNFIVVGVLKETNTSMDWLYFVPLLKSDIFNR